MDRRKFINASALTGAGLIAGSYLKGNGSATSAGESSKSNGTQAKQMIDLPATKIPVVLEADVVVIGGGPAGFGAAMRAARNGVSTILIERWAIPGGAATSGYMCVTGQGSSFPLHSEWVD